MDNPPWRRFHNTASIGGAKTEKKVITIWLSVAVAMIISPGRLHAVADVLPTAETDPANGSGYDNADDACIWIHPTDPCLSLVIGQSKDDIHGGVHVYDLSGDELQFSEDGKMNSTDLRYNFPLDGGLVDIVVFSNRSDDSLAIYKVNSSARRLENVGTISTGHSVIYGLCMYHSPITNKFYAVPNYKDGTVQQWELFDNGSGRVTGTKVREFDVGSQPEGCVADDGLARLYIGEEDVGIWEYGAEPTDGTARTSVDTVGGGCLSGGVEGLTIYYASGAKGYLIASSQGNSTFVIYQRHGNNDYIETFEIVNNDTLGIDGCSDTDGIDVTNVNLGSAFPNGLFVAHDHHNTGDDDDNSNFKFVPWDSIANAVSPALTIDTSRDPRAPRRGDFDIDGDIDWYDLRTLVEQWLNTCLIGQWCGHRDIDQSTRVDFIDFAILAEGWTGRIEP